MSEQLFKVVSPFKPTGDQPTAIAALEERIKGGAKHSCLLGATGTGKTFTMANLIERLQRPTLVLSHNKTLAAQLFEEFKELFLEMGQTDTDQYKAYLFLESMKDGLFSNSISEVEAIDLCELIAGHMVNDDLG